MKTRIQLQSIPDADPIPNAVVTVRSIASGTTLDTVVSDADGFVTLSRDGHLEPYYFYANGLPGGDKFWRSDEMMTAGATSPWDWPAAMIPLGNGVVDGYLNELAVSVNGTTLTIATGGGLILGHPIVQYTAFTTALSRPSSGTRTDRAILRLYPAGSATTPGKADLAVLPGADEIGTVPSLTQTSTVYELPLARITVPNAGTLTVSDERQMLSAERHTPVTDQVTANGPIVTDEAGGEALSGVSLTLTLPDEGTYDITATLSGTQGPVAGSTNWTNVATYGPTFNGLAISNPGQVATDSTSRVLIADTGNSRLVILDSAGAYATGITGLTGIVGVCVDSSDNIYIIWGSNYSKYNSSLALQYSNSFFDAAFTHITTDSTHFYTTSPALDVFRKKLCSTGATVASYGSSGTGDGQFGTAHGIAYSSTDSLLYIVDRQASDRVQVFNTTGTFQRKWTINDSDTTAYAINADASGDIFVSSIQAFAADGIVRRTTNAGVAIDSFVTTGGVATGIGVASGDVVWLASDTVNTVQTWGEVTSSAGYGQLAVEIDGSVGTYVGAGNRDTAMKVVGTGSKAGGFGPVTVVVRGFGKATTGDATFKSLSLSAEARSRR